MRGCVSQIAHVAANKRRAPGAAGVSQPWKKKRAGGWKNASLRRHSGMQGGAAGVSQPWLASRVCKSEIAARRLRRPFASTKRRCKCVTEPRRADARRSCEWAFAHRKNRFFARRRPYTNTRAGGVSPPWLGNRVCMGDSAHVHLRPSHRQARAGGVSPPWYLYNASARAIRRYTVGGLPNRCACVCANVFPTRTAG
jgi:hypothetical protein